MGRALKVLLGVLAAGVFTGAVAIGLIIMFDPRLAEDVDVEQDRARPDAVVGGDVPEDGDDSDAEITPVEPGSNHEKETRLAELEALFSQGEAPAFDPQCAANDALCAAWNRYRREWPFPHQTIALAPISPTSAALIISEPPPSSTRDSLKTLVRMAFGDDFVRHQTFAWMIGRDGWVSDFVVQINVAPFDVANGELLDDPLLSDRLAFLYLELFGTTYGASPLLVGQEGMKPAARPGSNISVSPLELQSWMQDPSLSWSGFGDFFTEPRTFDQLLKSPEAAVYASNDGMLVALKLPLSVLAEQRNAPEAMEKLRPLLRHFAVASDLIFGGLWNESDAVIVARARAVALEELPPLRVETVALLASQSSDQLAQSYERNSLFAGKLSKPLRDWAPIYLSNALIDTELGALLNITDQMLKSWSLAGDVEYIYFDYPLRPQSFAFNNRSLSKTLQKEHGSARVLFNWNTQGAAAVVQFENLKVLGNGRTGSLPITYGGAELGGEMKTGHLFEYEELGYDYFAELGDPNLVRVVQYTTLYQLFQAISEASESTANDGIIPARQKAIEVLVEQTESLIRNLPANSVALAKVAEFRNKYPELSDRDFYLLLVDRYTEQSVLQSRSHRLAAEVKRRNQEAKEIKRAVESNRENIDLYNDQVSRGVQPAAGMREALERRSRELDERIQAINAWEPPSDDELKRLAARMKEAESVVGALKSAAAASDLAAIEKEYVARNSASEAGWIKTPSVVISWSKKQALFAVGGHNVNARSLRFEPSPETASIEVATAADGTPVLKYNPKLTDQIAGNAREISRLVEHRSVKSSSDLIDQLQAKPIRERSKALQLEPMAGAGGGGIIKPPKSGAPGTPTAAGPERWSGSLGRRNYGDKTAFIEDLRRIILADDCCLYVAKDGRGYSYLGDRNPGPPPGSIVVEARDAVALRIQLEHFKSKAPQKELIFIDHTPEQVHALTAGLGDSSAHRQSWAESLGERRASADEKESGAILVSAKGGDPIKVDRPQSSKSTAKEWLDHMRAWFRLPAKEKPTTQKITPEKLNAILEKAGWNQEVDGAPRAISVHFKSLSDVQIDVVAGFKSEVSEAKSIATLKEAVDDSAPKLKGERTIKTFTEDLKKRIQALPKGMIRRFMIILRKGGDEIHLSRLPVKRGAVLA